MSLGCAAAASAVVAQLAHQVSGSGSAAHCVLAASLVVGAQWPHGAATARHASREWVRTGRRGRGEGEGEVATARYGEGEEGGVNEAAGDGETAAEVALDADALGGALAEGDADDEEIMQAPAATDALQKQAVRSMPE